MSKGCILVQQAKEMSGEEKEQLIKKIEQDAHDNEVMYWGCGRAVIDALQRHLNLGDSEVFKAASPLAGGVGRMGEACGALIAGVMAIGLAYAPAKFAAGKVCREDPEYTEATVRAHSFCEGFKEKFGCLRCSDVKAAVRGVHYKEYTRRDTIEAFEDHAKCGDVTGLAARLAAEIILQPTELFRAEIDAALEDLSQVRKQRKG